MITDSASVLQDASDLLKNYVSQNASSDIAADLEGVDKQQQRRAMRLHTGSKLRCATCGKSQDGGDADANDNADDNGTPPPTDTTTAASEPVASLSRALLSMKDDIHSLSMKRPHHAALLPNKMYARSLSRAIQKPTLKMNAKPHAVVADVRREDPAQQNNATKRMLRRKGLEKK